MGEFVSDGIFREKVVFTAQDTDRFGRVKSSVLLHQLEQIATTHYDALGLDRDLTTSHGCFWAVIRTELALCVPPPVERTLYLDTWSGRQSHGLFWRHYRLQDPEGTVYIRGVSVWVLMDIQTRTMSRDRSWVTEKGGVSQPDELKATLRSPALPTELPQRQDRTVERSDADFNGHLNNAEYLRWADDLLPEEFAVSHRPAHLWIEYKKELPLGQTAVLQYLLEDGALYLRGTVEDKDSFILRCDYDSI